jgi:hypothetical protein
MVLFRHLPGLGCKRSPADILQIEMFRARRDGGGMTLKDEKHG